jgi:exodeoxyribonuclease VII large subunit
VGHETDFTLADFVADQRAATPSQAAELAVPDVSEVIQRINSARERLQMAAVTSIKDSRRSLEAIMDSFVFTQPLRMLESSSMRLDNLQSRLNKIATQLVKEKKNQLLHDMEKLELINPLGVIRRGYGIVHDQKGTIVSDISNIKVDDMVSVRLNGGQFDAQIKAIREE